jgi:hypothetical protein
MRALAGVWVLGVDRVALVLPLPGVDVRVSGPWVEVWLSEAKLFIAIGGLSILVLLMAVAK